MYTIYNLFKKDSNECYIGKTRDVPKRMALHKYYSKSSTYKLYEFMRANGGYENFDYEILETDIPNEQGNAKERYYYNLYTPSLNSNVPNRSQHESKLQYRNKNRLQLIEKVREWQRENRIKFNAYQKEYQRKKKEFNISLLNNESQTIMQSLQI